MPNHVSKRSANREILQNLRFYEENRGLTPPNCLAFTDSGWHSECSVASAKGDRKFWPLFENTRFV